MNRVSPRSVTIMVAAAGSLVVLLVAGLVWAAFQLADQLGAPGIAPPTGTGPCGTSDAVNVQLGYADGHSLAACTRDLPACQARTTAIVNGQSRPVSPVLALDHQLRTSGRRYILLVEVGAIVQADMPERVFTISPFAFLPKGPTQSVTDGSALVEVTPRDPTEGNFTTSTGTVTLSSTAGVARGVIDGQFGDVSLATIKGDFRCRI